MATCLVRLSEQNLSNLLALRRTPDETLDEVVRRTVSTPPTVSKRPKLKEAVRPYEGGSGRHTVSLLGEVVRLPTKRRVLFTVLKMLADLDPSFLEALSYEKGRTRRLVARDPEQLYEGRSDLAHHAWKITDDWWMATNISGTDILKAIALICRVTGLEQGDIEVCFGS